jgi:hypothetical protein
LSLARLTFRPPELAALVKVTVHVAIPGGLIVAGVQMRLPTSDGPLTVMISATDTAPEAISVT